MCLVLMGAVEEGEDRLSLEGRAGVGRCWEGNAGEGRCREVPYCNVIDEMMIIWAKIRAVMN